MTDADLNGASPGSGDVSSPDPQACPECAVESEDEDVLGPELLMAMRIYRIMSLHPRYRQVAELYAGRDIEEVLSPEEAERFFDYAMAAKLFIVTIIGLLVANG